MPDGSLEKKAVVKRGMKYGKLTVQLT